LHKLRKANEDKFKQNNPEKAQMNIIYPDYWTDERLKCSVEIN
jgi:hypothetical protein